MSLAEGHVLRFLNDVSVNDEHVGELCSEAQFDLSPAVKVETHALRKLWIKTQNTKHYEQVPH